MPGESSLVALIAKVTGLSRDEILAQVRHEKETAPLLTLDGALCVVACRHGVFANMKQCLGYLKGKEDLRRDPLRHPIDIY